VGGRRAGAQLIGGADRVDGVCVLRTRWRSASLAAGWPFPSDWELAAVDEVCIAAADGGDLAAAVAALGRARAWSGSGLDETLLDLAALHAVLASDAASGVGRLIDLDVVPSPLLRATALGWAEVASDLLGSREAVDPATGMATASYLRTRLGEVYRARAWVSHLLLFAALDVSPLRGLPRSVAMALVGEALREVFPGGETVALVGPSVAAVLARRDGVLSGAVAGVRRLLGRRLAVDSQLRVLGPPAVWSQPLPDTHSAACELLARLRGRAS